MPPETDSRTRLAITLGDPRGIGPEIVAAALGSAEVRESVELIVVGPANAGVQPDVVIGEWGDSGDAVALAGRLSGRAVERAVELVLAGEVEGIVTAPVHKQALFLGGYDYPGLTEMLAALTSSPTAMMLASERLRVVLATTHIPLRDVVTRLSRDLILRTAEITRRGLVSQFGIAQPRIALCAVNPHAGDEGRFGNEDRDLLGPAAREAGIAGPFPADTVFVRAMRGEFDAVIAPYHDVGMTAIKVASFGSAVNVTLGLPFPRCSPDHGTALDIAGRGLADPASMLSAVRLCADLAARARTRAQG